MFACVVSVCRQNKLYAIICRSLWPLPLYCLSVLRADFSDALCTYTGVLKQCPVARYRNVGVTLSWTGAASLKAACFVSINGRTRLSKSSGCSGTFINNFWNQMVPILIIIRYCVVCSSSLCTFFLKKFAFPASTLSSLRRTSDKRRATSNPQ
jgi:hypothetical protein